MQSGLSRPVTSSVDLPHPPLPITCPGILTDVEKRCKTTPSLSPRTKHIQLSYASKQATRFLCSLRQTFLQGWQIVLYCVWHNPASEPAMCLSSTQLKAANYIWQHNRRTWQMYTGQDEQNHPGDHSNSSAEWIWWECSWIIECGISLLWNDDMAIHISFRRLLWVSKQQSLSDLSAVTLKGLLCMYCGCLCGRQIYCCTFTAPSTIP